MALLHERPELLFIALCTERLWSVMYSDDCSCPPMPINVSFTPVPGWFVQYLGISRRLQIEQKSGDNAHMVTLQRGPQGTFTGSWWWSTDYMQSQSRTVSDRYLFDALSTPIPLRCSSGGDRFLRQEGVRRKTNVPYFWYGMRHFRCVPTTSSLQISMGNVAWDTV